VRGKGAKLGEGCPKARLSQGRLPNRAINVPYFPRFPLAEPAEIGGNKGRYFTRTPIYFLSAGAGAGASVKTQTTSIMTINRKFCHSANGVHPILINLFFAIIFLPVSVVGFELSIL
jgi:hypothetical protein